MIANTRKLTSPYFSSRKVSVTLWFFLVGTVLWSLGQGAASLGWAEVLSGLQHFDSNSKETIIVWSIRVPRILLAITVGAMLAISGTVMQGLFRNPLADPSLIGVTAGASVGASLAIVAASSLISSYWFLAATSLGAFLGGILATTLVYTLSTDRFKTSVSMMLLVGIAITALASTVTRFLEYFSDNNTLRQISLWQMGGLDRADYTLVALSLTTLLLLAIVTMQRAVALNALLLGESEARHLGIAVEPLKRTMIVMVAIAVACCVAASGTIGFVGLVVPHIMRMIVGPCHRKLIPVTALAGALLVVLADAISRTIIAPNELPVGLLTAAIGVPFFISLLRRRHQYGM